MDTPHHTTDDSHLLENSQDLDSLELHNKYLLIVIYFLTAITTFLFLALLVLGFIILSIRKKSKEQMDIIEKLKAEESKRRNRVPELVINAVKIEPTNAKDDLTTYPRKSEYSTFKRSFRRSVSSPHLNKWDASQTLRKDGAHIRIENEYVKDPTHGEEDNYITMGGRPESEHDYEDDKWVREVLGKNHLQVVSEH